MVRSDTWGGEFIPIEGKSVHIPAGLHLLVDVDSTPILNAVFVERTLIFPSVSDENHLRTFDVHYIYVNCGYLEVGTKNEPYRSRLILIRQAQKFQSMVTNVLQSEQEHYIIK
jgi:hypothetical protein